MTKKAVAAAAVVSGVLHGVLLAVGIGLLAMVFAAYWGAPWPVVLAGGVLGLSGGTALARRVWFPCAAPAAVPPAEPASEPIRFPGFADEFERLAARQRVLASLLIAALAALLAVRVAAEFGWTALFGLPRERLLYAALAVAAVVLPLGLWNWRCPRCRRNLGPSLSIRSCPRCGIVLRG